MEAWILHVRAETIQEDGKTFVGNRYTAWMSEKQALKAVAKYLTENTEHPWAGPFVNNSALRNAIRSLVEANKVKEAIDLVNTYSEAAAYKSGLSHASSSKIQIIITQSTFLGSPFD